MYWQIFCTKRAVFLKTTSKLQWTKNYTILENIHFLVNANLCLSTETQKCWHVDGYRLTHCCWNSTPNIIHKDSQRQNNIFGWFSWCSWWDVKFQEQCGFSLTFQFNASISCFKWSQLRWVSTGETKIWLNSLLPPRTVMDYKRWSTHFYFSKKYK